MFTNDASPKRSKKQERRDRAALRIQTTSNANIGHDVQQHLEAKLIEFKALVRARAIPAENIYGAACNILAGYSDKFDSHEHQRWLAVFNKEGKRAAGLEREQ